MQVILLHDVPKVGKKFETKSVADGFAMNSLIPKGLAIVATKNSAARVEVEKNRHEAEQKVRMDLLLKNFSSINGVSVTIAVPANDKGHLFSGIHAGEIAKALHESKRLDVPEGAIILPKPIKSVGTHEIEILVADKKGAFTLVVEALPAHK